MKARQEALKDTCQHLLQVCRQEYKTAQEIRKMLTNYETLASKNYNTKRNIELLARSLTKNSDLATKFRLEVNEKERVRRSKLTRKK